MAEASELSNQELESVAGGAPAVSSGDTCSTAACWGFTCLDPSECE